HIDGQGRCLGGVILSSQQFVADHLQTFLRQTGPSISPFNAWVLLKGIETLPLRVEKMQSNAAKLADFLAGKKAVKKALYPFRKDHPQYELARKQMKGGGTMLSFELDGGVPLLERAPADPHLEQSRGREIADHTPCDDDASALHAGSAGGDGDR